VTVQLVAPLTIGFAVALGGVLALLSALWWRDRDDAQPVHLVVLAVAWGGALAPAFRLALGRLGAGQVGGPWAWGNAALALVAAAVVAELIKGLGVGVLARRADGPTDGMILGFAAGAAWAATEPLGNLVAGGTMDWVGGGLAATATAVAVGVVVGGLASATLGGLLVTGWLARRPGERVLWLGAGPALAVGLHSGFRLVRPALAATAGGFWSWLALLAAVVALTWAEALILLRVEGRVLAEELSEEVEWRVAPPWVLQVLPSYRERVRGAWWPDAAGRVVIARLLSRLALRKRALRRLSDDKLRLAALEVGRLRGRVRATLMPPAEPGGPPEP
jgi:protease PrsW